MSDIVENLKKVKRKIPFIQYPASVLYTYRFYGKQAAFDYALPPKPHALRNMKIEDVKEDILFSVVVPLYNTDPDFLRELIESVINQSYSNWELILADASDKNKDELCILCEEYEYDELRLRYVDVPENKGISANTNYAIKNSTGDIIVLCDHDDLLHKDALKMIAISEKATGAPVFYSDEDHVDEKGKHLMPLYKPDWSRDLLYSQMYTCHLFAFRREIFEQVGGFDSEMDGAQDYDLMLRFSEVTDEICHIPMSLYSWRETSESTAKNSDSKPYAHTAGLKALNAHLYRRYEGKAKAFETKFPFVYRTRFDTLSDNPLVSIIMPMKDNAEMTDFCIKSIVEKTKYKNYEIILLNNRSEKAETISWFKIVEEKYPQVKLINADFEFNWSKLNNFGMEHANGDIFIFMNNDMEVLTGTWMNFLCENAMRDEVGVVGPLLLYDDRTIQHAGIIVGMGGWADHVYKGAKVKHFGSPFVSPLVTRNVSAVTGACMAITRDKVEKIGGFDERFIICGSDVEMCIRAYAYGYNNIYNPCACLTHFESKSRDSYIPEIDFTMSYNCYTFFRENGDPFYNINLDTNRVIPIESRKKMDYQKIKEHIKNGRLTKPVYTKIRSALKTTQTPYDVVEVQPIYARKDDTYEKKRLNLLIPSLNTEHVFGGIATALKFYKQLGEHLGCDLRVLQVDAELKIDQMVEMDGFKVVKAEDNSDEPKQIVPFANRAKSRIYVGKNDIFMATAWWTAYTIQPVIKWQKKVFGVSNPFIYFIQDYEPGFYSWSSRYLMAESTYKSDIPTIAIHNSKLLYDFFASKGYKFYKDFYFEPVLNDKLKEEFASQTSEKAPERKKQILLYGRPGTERNAFELVVASLNEWAKHYKNASDWSIISLGEKFDDVKIANGLLIKAYGKVSLEEYAKLMLESKIGISLMVSPHPSYPPLEMSTFGMKVITNTYDIKDLSSFNDNIVSVDNCSSTEIAKVLAGLCMSDLDNSPVDKGDYYDGNAGWNEIIENIEIWSNK